MSIDPVSLAITAALTAAQMAMNASRKIEGPRLDDLSVTVADYGTPLNYFYGTRRFAGVPVIWAEPLKEVKRKRKTKGGKYNEYTYYGTWAIAVADHEIDAITRIWFDKHLVYDATGVGPITPFSLSKHSNLSDSMRFYLGTETQEADPRMVATIEAKYGAGSCPAYRGVAYIVFEEVPLEKLGNRIPQISVEATSSASSHYPWEEIISNNDPNESNSGYFGTRFVNPTGVTTRVVDLPSRQLVVSGAMPYSIMGGGVGITPSGSFYALTGSFFDWVLWLMGPDGGGVGLVAGGSFHDGPFVEGCDYVGGLVCVYPYTFIRPDIMYYDNTTIVVVSNDFIPTHYFEDEEGAAWAVGDGGSGAVAFYQMPFGPFFTVASSSADGGAWAMDNGQGQYFVIKGGLCLLIDKETHTLVSSVTAPAYRDEQMQLSFRNAAIGASSIWIKFSEVSTITGSTLRTVSGSSWSGSGTWGPTSRAIYEPINHALLGWPSGGGENNLRLLYLDRGSGSGATLQTVVEDVSARCAIDPGDLSASALDQTVDGYSWTQGAGKAIIDPLLDIYDSVARPHDFTVEFMKLGSSSAGTIDVSEFAVQDGSTRYSINVDLDTDLPRRLTVSFSDADHDQQSNSVVVQRPLDSVDGVRETSIDLTTWVANVDYARHAAERYFRRKWNERETYSHALTNLRTELEPADVHTLGLDDVSRTARLEKLTFSGDDSLKTEWRRDFPGLATESGTTGATMDGRVDSQIFYPIQSATLVFDIPLIRDSDASTNPELYYGGAPYTDGTWPGEVIYEKDGTDYDLEIATVDSSSPSTWGRTTDVLDSATHYLWDRGNSVNVDLNYGTLTSATEAECNANPRLNLCLIGQELIQFATATLEMDGSYTLTDLKRGRRGTEWAIGTHISGDIFVMMNAMAPVEMGAGDFGNSLSFKAVTTGLDVETAIPITIDPYTAATNKPWAPDQFRATKNYSSGDWVFTWRRRSRVAGDYAPFAPALGESAESYKLKIYDGVTILRTITVSSETATWTKAQQETDFGGEKWATVSAGVLQVGDLADGYETTGTFHGTAPASNLVFVGGKTAELDSSTGTDTTVLTDLTGGIASAPSTGDIVVVAYGADADFLDLALATSGYTRQEFVWNGGLGTDVGVAAFTKVMGGTPDTSVQVVGPFFPSSPGLVAIQVWRNPHATTPFDSGLTALAGTRNPDPPAIRPLVERSVIICIGANSCSSSEPVSAPTQTGSELSNFIGIGTSFGTPMGLGIGSVFWDGLGYFDPIAWVGGGSGTRWAAISLAIRST